MFFTCVPSVLVAAATRRATAGGSFGALAKTRFGPGSPVARWRYWTLVTMNESFGADGNSWTMPTTWKGTTRNLPLRRSRTRSFRRSPRFSE